MGWKKLGLSFRDFLRKEKVRLTDVDTATLAVVEADRFCESTRWAHDVLFEISHSAEANPGLIQPFQTPSTPRSSDPEPRVSVLGPRS